MKRQVHNPDAVAVRLGWCAAHTEIPSLEQLHEPPRSPEPPGRELRLHRVVEVVANAVKLPCRQQVCDLRCRSRHTRKLKTRSSWSRSRTEPAVRSKRSSSIGVARARGGTSAERALRAGSLEQAHPCPDHT